MNLSEKLTVAISSRALFDLDESHAVFEREGVEAYCRYQVEHEDIPLALGGAFGLVKKLLALNEHDSIHPRIELILLSRNSADTEPRIFNPARNPHPRPDTGWGGVRLGRGGESLGARGL